VRRLQPASESEMIASFLRHELDSSRLGTSLRMIIDREQILLAVVSAPDVTDTTAMRSESSRWATMVSFPRRRRCVRTPISL